jgi:hypothetical protein
MPLVLRMKNEEFIMYNGVAANPPPRADGYVRSTIPIII